MTPEDSAAEIERLEARGARDPRTHTFARLADLYRKAGELERALEIIEGGLRHHPHYLNARIVHARLLRELGRDADAARAFEHVLRIDSENAVAQAALAELSGSGSAGARSAPPRRPPSSGWLARLDEEWRTSREEAPSSPAPPAGDEGGEEAPSGAGGRRAGKRAGSGDLETVTLAELYVRQGLFDAAVGIYERLLARDPYNARLAGALDDARRRAAGEAPDDGAAASRRSATVPDRTRPSGEDDSGRQRTAGEERPGPERRAAVAGRPESPESPAASDGATIRAFLQALLDGRLGAEQAAEGASRTSDASAPSP